MTSAENVAEAFHESYERQAPSFNYGTRKASSKPWDGIPSNNKRLMIAVVQDLLDRGVISYGR